MFKAYWFPVTLFYVFPSIVVFSIKLPFNWFEFLKFACPFILAIFIMGYLLAPLIGPKVEKNKVWSLIMALICSLFGLAVFIVSLIAPNFSELHFSLTILVAFFVASIFPVFLGSILFIGACEKLKAT